MALTAESCLRKHAAARCREWAVVAGTNKNDRYGRVWCVREAAPSPGGGDQAVQCFVGHATEQRHALAWRDPEMWSGLGVFLQAPCNVFSPHRAKVKMITLKTDISIPRASRSNRHLFPYPRDARLPQPQPCEAVMPNAYTTTPQERDSMHETSHVSRISTWLRRAHPGDFRLEPGAS